ncbi:hypothetical protein APSETT445_008502 [Aspergillus pseudonomiae]
MADKMGRIMAQEHHLDALVVGAGFGGIYTLYSLIKEGLNVKAIDTAGDVGGTWYWNRYPGALSDTWSHLYRFLFDHELLQNYPWKKWYLTQPEILEYLRHVVERYDLRKHMQFNTKMQSATWNDTTKSWKVVTAIADKVKSLHVFVRRPQYSVPSGNRDVTPEERARVNKDYPGIITEVRTSNFAMGTPEPTRKFMSVSPEDREALLERLWQTGNGFMFMFGGFSDIATDDAVNEEVCQFLRKKIASIVKDPQKRDVLTPKELYGRRPLCDGMSVHGFPNLLLVNGPHMAFSNIPISGETNTEFIMDLVRRAEEVSKQTGRQCEIEALEDAERAWTERSRASAAGTVFEKVPSWLLGNNVAGKAVGVSFYFGGLGTFRAFLADIKTKAFEGFKSPLGPAILEAQL